MFISRCHFLSGFISATASLNIEKHLKRLREATWDLREKWWDLGLELGISVDTLQVKCPFFWSAYNYFLSVELGFKQYVLGPRKSALMEANFIFPYWQS